MGWWATVNLGNIVILENINININVQFQNVNSVTWASKD